VGIFNSDGGVGYTIIDFASISRVSQAYCPRFSRILAHFGELERDLARMAHDTRPDLDGIDEAVRRIFDTLQRIEEKRDGKQDR
jgi:hypothetical protein